MSARFKVGSLVRPSATGTQAITGVGFIPKAVMFWTSGGNVDGTIRNQSHGTNRTCVGFASGTTSADRFAASTMALAAGSGSGVATITGAITLRAAAAARIDSFDSDGFTLNWIQQVGGTQTEAQIIHFLAIGGDEIQAKVRSFTTPATQFSTFSVTGVGFKPKVVIFAGATTPGIPLENVSNGCDVRVGIATETEQWALGISSDQALGSAAWRRHRNDLCYTNGNPLAQQEVEFASMDADGFTLNQGQGTSLVLGALCLDLPDDEVEVGSFFKNSSFVELDIRPSCVLLVSDQDIYRATAASQTGARMGISAFTDTDARSSVFSIPNEPTGTVRYGSIEKSAKAAVKINSDPAAIDDESTGVLNPSVAEPTANGFTLTWNPDDGVATEYIYLAIGPKARVAFKTGHFTKATPLEGVTQAITGVGFKPKALLFWTAGGKDLGTIWTQADTLATSVPYAARACVGIVSGTPTLEQFAMSTSAENTIVGGSRHSQKAILLNADDGATVIAYAVLASFDSDGFTLTWTWPGPAANDAEQQIIHYFAIGGEQVEAKVVTVHKATEPTNFSVTGVGFQPTLVLFVGGMPAGVGLDTASNVCLLQVGAATGPHNRWNARMQHFGVVPPQTWRQHQTDRCYRNLDLISMDADGFTVSQDEADFSVVGVLCLSFPGEVVLGSFVKPSGISSGGISGLGFRPAAALLVSDMDIPRNGALGTHARFTMSAFCPGDLEQASVLSIPDQGPHEFACLEHNRAALKIDNDTPTLDAAASAGMNFDGLTMTWSPNDSAGTEYLYIIFSDTPASETEGHIYEMELDGVGRGFTQIEDVLLDPEVKLSYGIQGEGPTDFVAGPETLSFALDNSEANSGGKLGWYTPDGPNVRPGFARGIRVRYRYRVPGTVRTYTKFLGRLLNPDPKSGQYLERRTMCDAVGWMAAAADYEVRTPVQVSKRSDRVLAAVLASVPTSPGALQFDAGDSTFAYALDSEQGRPPNVLTEINRICRSEPGWFYTRGGLNQGGMIARFERRSSRLAPLPKAEFIGYMHNLVPVTDIRNVARITAHPKTVDASVVVLFSKPSTSVPPVGAGQVVKITGRYSDPSQRANKVGGFDMVSPVSGTDYAMFANADGTGTNLTANFTVVADYHANQVEYTITNNGGTTGYVTLLQARGKGVYNYTPVDAVHEDAATIASGEAPITLDMPYQGDVLVAQAVAEHYVQTWSVPGSSAARMLFVPRDYEEVELGQSLEPGDPVRLAEVMTGMNGVYFIQNVQITPTENELAIFEYGLQRALIDEWWTLGVAGFSELGITTVLAPL